MRAAGIGEPLRPPRNKWQDIAFLLSASEAGTLQEALVKLTRLDDLTHADSAILERLQMLVDEKVG